MPQPKNGVSLVHALFISVLGLAEFSRGALILSLLPAYVTGPLGDPLTVVGWAISVHYLLDTVFRGPSGWIVDHVGPTRVLTAGVAVEIIAFMGLMHSTSSSGVIFYVGLLGVGTAAHWPAVVTAINRITATERRASMMGLVFAAWLAGAGVGPVLINFLVKHRDHTAFILLVAVDSLALVLTLFIADSRLRMKDHVPPPIQERFRAIWPFRYVLPGMFVQNMTLGVMLPIFRQFTVRILHLNHWQFAELLLGSGTLTVLLLVPMGKFTDRFGNRFPLIAGFLIAGLALSGIAFLRGFLELVIAGGVLGLSYALILPSWNSFLAEKMPKDIEGWLWGVFMTVEGLGMAVGPILGARLFSAAEWLPFLVSAVILVIMGGFYAFFPFQKYMEG